MAANISMQPSLDEIHTILEQCKGLPNPPNLIPVCASISSEFLTPSAIYLKVAAHSNDDVSFLFESAATTETIGRWSFIGAAPRKILISGPKHGFEGDPLPRLAAELDEYRVAHIPSLRLPPLTGGAIGYVGYDCVKYFEPKTKREMQDVLGVPESFFMLCDTVVAVDHFFQKVLCITYLRVPPNNANNNINDAASFDLKTAYTTARQTLSALLTTLRSPSIPLPPQGPIHLDQTYTSNIGRPGYEAHVTTLKSHITAGDIIQAVPSQRIARPSDLHPFNIYRHLRTVNPSPYMFYLSCGAFSIVGASPEVLVKVEEGRVITHPIAGTIRRGRTPKEDEELAAALRGSVKDRAEHVMLVDLARNDVNRVCLPQETRVERLMVTQKFSHVQHLTSEVSGVLRPGKTRFDAFRSIFPAGTVSGAPKVKAMELIAELEKETRGIYAGAVGYFGYPSLDISTSPPTPLDGAMDTCIALRTMLVKDGVVYLQAGGGIVFDSVEREEWEETVNKLAANMRCIEQAERLHYHEQLQAKGGEVGLSGGEGGEEGEGGTEGEAWNAEVQGLRIANGAPKGPGRVDLGGE